MGELFAQVFSIRRISYNIGQMDIFTGARFSDGGFFGRYKGTCAVLGRCVKALGEDVALWLENPSLDTKLGDAK